MYTREQLLATPEHSQFLLMNASKSDDCYAQYSGVAPEDLLDELLLGSATGVTVYAPDGFSQYHPLYPAPRPLPRIRRLLVNPQGLKLLLAIQRKGKYLRLAAPILPSSPPLLAARPVVPVEGA